jgi:hypothetical protein
MLQQARAPQPMKMAEEEAGEGPLRVVSITGRSGHQISDLVFKYSDGSERRFDLGGERPTTGYTMPLNLSPDEWIVQVQQIRAKESFLGGGLILILNTGRKFNLVGTRAHEQRVARFSNGSFFVWNQSVVDNASEHVVGLKFNDSGLEHIEVASRVSGGCAKEPEKIHKVAIALESIKQAHALTEMSKEMWERMRPKSCREHLIACCNADSDSDRGPPGMLTE